MLDYLAGGGKSLRQQYTEVFGKINLTDDAFETRGGRVQRDLLQNIGVIPNEGVVRETQGPHARHDRGGFLRNLQAGDIFIIAGRPVRLERIGMMECFVSAPTAPCPPCRAGTRTKCP